MKHVLRGTDRSERDLRRLALLVLMHLTHGDLRSVFTTELERADLVEADFQGADLYNVSFKEAFLILSDFHNANLTQANLTRTHLRGATMSGAILNNTNLADADWFNAFGITLDQMENARQDGLLTCPSGFGLQPFIDAINERYLFKYNDYSPTHQAALREAWSSYSSVNGVCEYARRKVLPRTGVGHATND